MKIDYMKAVSEEENKRLKSGMEKLKLELKSEDPSFVNLHRKLDFNEIKNAAANMKNKGYDSLAIIGMGGSSLGAKAIIEAVSENAESCFFVDNLDEGLMDKLESWSLNRKVLYLPISKSGNTLEVLAVLDYLFEKGISKDDFFSIITPGKGKLSEFTEKFNWPHLTIPEDVGGRFSVFTAVGLFPFAFVGLDLETIKEKMAECEGWIENLDHEIYNFSSKNFRYFTEKSAENLVMFTYSDKLYFLGQWFCQLWGESLGKDGIGQLPVVARGASDQHSLLQLFHQGFNNTHYHFISVEASDPRYKIKNSECGLLSGLSISDLQRYQAEATAQSLTEQERPVSKITISKVDLANMTGLMMFYMFVTVISAELLDVNPFGQPGVERGKTLTWNKIKKED